MNRLAYTRVYLAGPINYAEDYGVGWRKYVVERLKKRKIACLNPQDKNKFMLYERSESENYVKFLNKLKQSSNYDELIGHIKKIRHIDLRCVDVADWLIVYWNMNIPMMGTAEELFWANRCKKPVLLVCEQGVNELNDWIFGCLPRQFLFSNFDEMFEYVRHIDEDEDIDELGRWVFFDYSRLYNFKE